MSIVTEKRCNKCGEWKDKSEFYKHKGGQNGLRSKCKACCLEESRKYKSDNSEKVKEQRKARYWKNPEKSRACAREHRNSDIEKAREKFRTYRKNNSEKERQRFKDYRLSNIEKLRLKFKEWYQNNREHSLEKSSLWFKSNRDKANVHHNNYLTRKKSNGGLVTIQEWRELKGKYNYTCLACGKKEPEIKLTIDHVLPLSMGGKNLIENIQPLCGSCNSSKRDKCIDYRGGLYG